MSPVANTAIWMSGAVVSFTAMAVAGRALSPTLDTFELMLYRSLIGVVIMFAIVALTGNTSQIRTQKFTHHLLRNVAHFAGQNLWFFAIPLIPLMQVFALEFTSPLWVILLAPFFLGESLTKIRALAALLGFVGILLVTRPLTLGVNPGTIAAVGAAVGFAITAILTKRLTRTESITTILIYLTLTQAVFGLICAGYDGNIALPDQNTAPWLVLVGIAGLLAHLCLTKALSIAPATVVMPFDFVRLPVIAIVGMTFYNEPLDFIAVLGALVIFGANYLNISAETRGPARLPR